MPDRSGKPFQVLRIGLVVVLVAFLVVTAVVHSWGLFALVTAALIAELVNLLVFQPFIRRKRASRA